MDILKQLNSVPMFLIAGGAIVYVMGLCVWYLVKSYRMGIAMGMDKKKLRKAITSSASFTVLPSVSILIGVIALAGSIGVPLPWVRLSVIGALHYEASVADISARATGMTGGLGTAQLTPVMFVTIGLVMSVGIIWGAVLCVILLKKYLSKIQKPKPEGQVNKKSFGDTAFIAMFIGLISAYIGGYVGTFASTGDYMPIVVAIIAAIAMFVFDTLAKRDKMTWLESFAMAASMLVGMSGAIVIGLF